MNTHKIGLALMVPVFAVVVSASGKAHSTIPASMFSGSSTSTASAHDVEAVVTALERGWAAAIVKKDVVALDRLLADDFNGTSPTAHTFTKTIAIQELKTGKYVVASMVLDEVSVNVYGDVAVAFTSQNESSQYAGTDTGGHYHFTDVWVNRGGRWQVVASHGSRFNESH